MMSENILSIGNYNDDSTLTFGLMEDEVSILVVDDYNGNVVRVNIKYNELFELVDKIKSRLPE